MANSFSFNGTDFSSLGLYVLRSSRPLAPPTNLSETALIRGDGAVASPARRGARTITLDCAVKGTTLSGLRESLDTIQTGLISRAPKQLILDTMSDRYFMAIPLPPETAEFPTRRVAEMTISFRCLDPFAYPVSSSDVTATLSSNSETVEVANAGTAYSRPQVDIVLSAATDYFSVRVEAMEQALSWMGDAAAGDTIRVDNENRQVLLQPIGGDTFAEEFGVGGDFFELAPAETNEVIFDNLSGADVTITKKDRYL